MVESQLNVYSIQAVLLEAYFLIRRKRSEPVAGLVAMGERLLRFLRDICSRLSDRSPMKFSAQLDIEIRSLERFKREHYPNLRLRSNLRTWSLYVRLTRSDVPFLRVTAQSRLGSELTLAMRFKRTIAER